MRRWAGAADEPDKLILPLEHVYTPAELSFRALKGADAGIASVLIGAAAQADCDLHLALVSIEESGSAEETGYYRGGRWDRDEDDEGENEDEEGFEVLEVFDRALRPSEWRRPDGSKADLGEFPFDEDELCPPDAFDELKPDEKQFHEATGNEGASFDRTYRRAGFVLWPRQRRLAVLNQAGLGTTLPHLEDLTARWEASRASTDAPLWREAAELSGHMLRSWPRSAWRDDDENVGRMLQLQVRLGNAEHIDAFLAGVCAEGNYAAQDNEAIVRAVALLAAPRAIELVVRIVSRNAAAHLCACGDLVRRCVVAPVGRRRDLIQIGAALIEALPGPAAKRPEADPWSRPEPVKLEFVVDLLTATSRIDATLAARAVEHVLTWPKTYPPDEVLVAAARAFARQPESAAGPAVARLRQASLDHLRQRIALPLEAPRDWSRTNRLTCKCDDCRALGAFLIAPGQKQWRLKAIMGRRGHVEDSVRKAACDLDLRTEKRGSPHTLVATKNQASYERRARQRRRDLEHVSALGG